jgi:hypothetical protein
MEGTHNARIFQQMLSELDKVFELIVDDLCGERLVAL